MASAPSNFRPTHGRARSWVQILLVSLLPMLALSALHVLHFPQWQMGAILLAMGLLVIPPFVQSVFRLRFPFVFASIPSLLVGELMAPAFFMQSDVSGPLGSLFLAGFVFLGYLVCYKTWRLEQVQFMK
ncbi:Uncharacterised protein [uncultured archaeon]|nr:Uncharacterised protein [uncultured archaeon]